MREIDIILKKLQNKVTLAEDIKFQKWLQQSEENQKFYKQLQLLKQEGKSFRNISYLDVNVAWNKLQQKVKTRPQNKSIPLYNKKWFRYAVAASILLFISISIFYNQRSGTKLLEPILVNNNVQAGTNKATLILGNGTKIALKKGKTYTSDNLSSDGQKIVYKNKVSDSISEEIAYNYLTIPRGGQYYVKLSDGTQIWLNSESKLKYPTSFIDGKERKVELIYGEAYFDVSPSTAHKGSKFKVLTGIQKIEVLGTQFNIKAYKNEDHIYTTLVKGKVSVYSSPNHKEILKPNEQSILSVKNKDITIINVDVSIETAWKRGVFSFENKPLKDIVKVLSRWYDVDIIFKDKKLGDIMFKGVLNKNENIVKILNIIQKTKFINGYEINKKIIIIK